ncbi:MAG: sulfotransferase [Candidatus Obscuribacterales bacterium]|nr:sulfotransferase [Candidatus Obscuribacterales bacterium]
MTWPNFFIIGAAKSGTTSLYANLKLHPQVYMSPMKEPGFYISEEHRRQLREDERSGYLSDREQYAALFGDAVSEKVIGEASPVYLWCESSPVLIKADRPEAKIVAILRQPAERLYSSYNYMRALGQEKLTFAEVIERIVDVGANDYYWNKYMREGFYYAGLSRWYQLFGEQQIKVYLYEDLKADAAGTLRDLCKFLGIDETLMLERPVLANVTGQMKDSPLLKAAYWFRRHPLLKPIRLVLKFIAQMFNADEKLMYHYDSLWNKSLVKPVSMQSEQKKVLTEYFRSDILQLEKLIHRDLQHWLP